MKNEQEYLVEKIRSRYTEKKRIELDELKALDKKVNTPANVFAYAFGTLSALVMGSGMSLVMTDIGQKIGVTNSDLVGIVIGVIGMAMAIANYRIYKYIIGSRRRKYAKEIISLSDRIIGA